MGVIELLLMAVGLSMDAFAVSVCKGLAIKSVTAKQMVIVGLWFGGFQALMPVIGYFVGSAFKGAIEAIDHWIAFALLLLIGLGMVREAVKGDDKEADASLSPRKMLPLALATSIDALAAGVSFAFLDVNIFLAALFIGVITFSLSMVGVKVGAVFGKKYQNRAELLGGVILILLGVKILVEHLDFFG